MDRRSIVDRCVSECISRRSFAAAVRRRRCKFSTPSFVVVRRRCRRCRCRCYHCGVAALRCIATSSSSFVVVAVRRRRRLLGLAITRRLVGCVFAAARLRTVGWSSSSLSLLLSSSSSSSSSLLFVLVVDWLVVVGHGRGRPGRASRPPEGRWPAPLSAGRSRSRCHCHCHCHCRCSPSWFAVAGVVVFVS